MSKVQRPSGSTWIGKLIASNKTLDIGRWTLDNYQTLDFGQLPRVGSRETLQDES